MHRTDVINILIQKYDYKKYLEIGIRGGVTFAKIKCNYKVGVDPVGNPTHKMTSDEFFKINKEKFDIIFIDGLHLEEQVLRDVCNSLDVLDQGGTIVMHDCNPTHEWMQIEEPLKGKAWCGTVWKAWVNLRGALFATETGGTKTYKMFVIDADYGLGVIQEGINNPHNCLREGELNWNFFNNNRKELLNLKSVDEWMQELR